MSDSRRTTWPGRGAGTLSPAGACRDIGPASGPAGTRTAMCYPNRPRARKHPGWCRSTDRERIHTVRATGSYSTRTSRSSTASPRATKQGGDAKPPTLPGRLHVPADARGDRALLFQTGRAKTGRSERQTPPTLTEHGVAMLSSVLNSERAVDRREPSRRSHARAPFLAEASRRSLVPFRSRAEEGQTRQRRGLPWAAAVFWRSREPGVGDRPYRRRQNPATSVGPGSGRLSPEAPPAGQGGRLWVKAETSPRAT